MKTSDVDSQRARVRAFENRFPFPFSPERFRMTVRDANRRFAIVPSLSLSVLRTCVHAVDYRSRDRLAAVLIH